MTDTLNQLTTSKTTDIVNNKVTSDKVYSYDENGNNTKEINSTQNITKVMTYDVDNRLDTYTKTENNETITQNNVYNGNGQRIQKIEGDNTINYYYQNENVLYTTDSDENKTSHNFVSLEGNTISTMRYDLTGLEYYIYNKDKKGSTTNLVDNNQNAKISYTYSDFGETTEYGDTDFYNEICYTGGIYDESTALYYLNARYYNPEDARFITQDTYRSEVNNPSSLHLYVYCINNPINYMDPYGNVPIAIPIGIEISKVALGYLLYIGGAIVVGGIAYISASKAKSEKNKYTYFKAIERNNDIYVGSGLSKSEAASRLRYDNVWSKTEHAAKSVAKKASPISKILGPEIDKNKGPKGKYYHFHVAKKGYNNVKDKGKSTRKINDRRYIMYKTHSFFGSKVN